MNIVIKLQILNLILLYIINLASIISQIIEVKDRPKPKKIELKQIKKMVIKKENS